MRRRTDSSPSTGICCADLSTTLKDGVEKLYVSAAAFLCRHRSVANYPTVELAVLKEMSQELAELFGLSLPVTCKKQANQATEHQLEERPALSI